MTYEDALTKLEKAVDRIQDDDTTLEESIACYEEGVKCYEFCMDLLKNAEQKIEVFSRLSDGQNI